MKEIYAALYLHAAGKEITEENLLNVVKSTGELTDEDKAKVKIVVSSLKGVNIDETLKSAMAAPVVAAPAVGEKAEKKEEKKEDEKKSEEEAAAGLSGLFG